MGINILYILIILFIVVICIDILPIFKDWLSRIHIGRYDDEKYWIDRLSNISKKWLNNTPKIKVTDNTRLVFIDILKKNYTKDEIQYWQEAALILGLLEYESSNNHKDISKIINKFLKANFNDNGEWENKPRNVDGAILAYALMNIENIKLDEYKPALDYIWSMIKDSIGEDGTVKYRNKMNDYRYVDTIGFICPFLVKYGVMFKNDECIELAVKQIKEYREFGMLKERSIPYHAYSIKTKIPLGLCGWGRGLGWYAIGLIDSWRELPDKNKYKEWLRQYVIEFAEEIISLQNDNGGWSWTATRKETRLDSSTSATLLWFLINAKQINEIKEECEGSIHKSIKYLMSVTRRSGEVDFSQGDTKDIGVYSILFNILPFTQGFTLRSISKIFKEGDK